MTEPAGPTETIDFLRCPTYWYLNKHWEPIGEWKPYFLLGAAVGEGLNTLFTGGTLDDALAVTQPIIEARYVDNDTWNREALEALIKKGLTEASKTTVKDILAQEKVLGCEVSIGSGRIDLVTRRGDDLVITDHKNKLQLDSRYLIRTLTETESDWQLWDYAYRAREYYQHTGQIITRRHLIVLTPRTKCHLHESVLKSEVLDSWATGAESVWSEIKAAKDRGTVEGLCMKLPECHGRYGQCVFYRACHTCNREEKAMEALYTRKEHRHG